MPRKLPRHFRSSGATLKTIKAKVRGHFIILSLSSSCVNWPRHDVLNSPPMTFSGRLSKCLRETRRVRAARPRGHTPFSPFTAWRRRDDVKSEVCALENEHQWMKKALWKSLIARRNGAGYVTRFRVYGKKALGASRFLSTFESRSVCLVRWVNPVSWLSRWN